MFAIFCIVAFVVLLGRLWYLQIALGSTLLAESETNRKRLVKMRAPRGMILDRKGRVLATSRPQFVVMAVPETLQKNPKSMATLCRTLGVTGEELTAMMMRERAAKFAPVRVAIDVPLDVVAKLMERRPILPGVSVEQDQLRSYPDGQLCSHVIGYIGEINEKQLADLRDQGMKLNPGDYVGKSGLEKQYEGLLHGTDGGQEIEVDARGRTRRILGIKPPVPGSTLTLSIDKDLQIAAERVMEGKTGAAVAVNPQTGEVLAMVSKPDFDPNIFVKKVKKADWDKIFLNKGNPLQNRTVSNKYPPGSTFKPVTATAALEYKVATPSTNLVCTGVGWYHRRCWKVHGHIDFTRAISQSCDVFFYEMGHRLGIERIAKMARAYGLGSRTNIDLPEATKKGTVPDEAWKVARFHEEWQPGETVVCAIGQGFIETTPLQMALVDAAVSMSGKRFQPHLVREIRGPNDKLATKVPNTELPSVPASPATFAAIKYGMRQTVIGPGGTGKVVNIEGVTVCGKTGSAEVTRGAAHGWFTCFAPMEKPEIAIAVICEHGRHGATSAAPVARAILDIYFGKKKLSDIKPGVAHVPGD